MRTFSLEDWRQIKEEGDAMPVDIKRTATGPIGEAPYGHMKSVWMDGVTIGGHEKLRGNISTEVLIVGGGMAGILCAYFLKQKGVGHVLAEAKRIGMGVTKDTTAKITAQHGLIYHKLISSREKGGQYLGANLAAVAEYGKLCGQYPCGFEEKPSYVYSTADSDKLEREARALESLGIGVRIENKTPLPFKAAALRFDGQAQFNPLQFIAGVSEGLNIYENTFVKYIDGNTAITNGGRITAKHIIIATHFPFINSKGFYFVKMYQHRSYTIALENACEMNGMYVDERQNGLSFRNYGGLLFVGGGDHRTGKTGGGWSELRQIALRAYPGAREVYSWATQDCMTPDSVPYIGKYSGTSTGRYVATGFNKWGMTSSMAAAMILSDMITGRKNEYADVFSPQRSSMKPQIFVNIAAATVNLLTPGKRCTHLGCALRWNPSERTWDCPCHGSRFSEKGDVINNPAMKNKSSGKKSIRKN